MERPVLEVNNLKKQLEDTKEKLKKAEEDLANKQQETKKVNKIRENLSSKTSQTITITNIEGYKNFSQENFYIFVKELKWEKTDGGSSDKYTMSKSYDANTGTLTLGELKTHFDLHSNNLHGKTWTIYDVYYIE